LDAVEDSVVLLTVAKRRWWPLRRGVGLSGCIPVRASKAPPLAALTPSKTPAST